MEEGKKGEGRGSWTPTKAFNSRRSTLMVNVRLNSVNV